MTPHDQTGLHRSAEESLFTVRFVPFNGFWSITDCNTESFMAANGLGIDSYADATAAMNEDGSYTINFAG